VEEKLLKEGELPDDLWNSLESPEPLARMIHSAVNGMLREEDFAAVSCYAAASDAEEESVQGDASAPVEDGEDEWDTSVTLAEESAPPPPAAAAVAATSSARSSAPPPAAAVASAPPPPAAAVVSAPPPAAAAVAATSSARSSAPPPAAAVASAPPPPAAAAVAATSSARSSAPPPAAAVASALTSTTGRKRRHISESPSPNKTCRDATPADRIPDILRKLEEAGNPYTFKFKQVSINNCYKQYANF